MKVRAYVFEKETGQYKTDPNGWPLQVHAEDAASLKEDYPHKHRRREYRDPQPNPKIRHRLKLVTKNETSFFSYIGDHSSGGNENVDQSESHRAAIVALSRLVKMKFFAPDSNLSFVPFTFTEVLIGPMLKLANGKEYYPDLLCRFSEDHPLYDRWGGKLAIEVTYSHPCEDTKTHDFMFHNIPILEVVIEKGSPKEYPGERYNWSYYALSSIEKHTDTLETWFRDYILVNVLVDPISNRIHERITKELSEECQRLNAEKKLISKYLSDSEESNSALQENLDNLTLNKKGIIETHIGEQQYLRKTFEKRIDTLMEDKSIAETQQKRLSEALNSRSTQALYFVIISTVLFTGAIGALIASIWFRESAIDVINWYFNLLVSNNIG